jgi:hypothetical protein
MRAGVDARGLVEEFMRVCRRDADRLGKIAPGKGKGKGGKK